MTTLVLDPDEIAEANHVINETHTLNSNRMRLVAPNQGAFFVDDTLVLRDDVTGRELIEGEEADYYPAEIAELPSGLYRKKICLVLMIVNPALTRIAIDYRALGDFYSKPESNLVKQFDNINGTGHDWKWGPLVVPVRPEEYPPLFYKDHNDNRVGFEYLTQALHRLGDTVLNGFASGHDDVYKYIDKNFNESRDQLNDQLARLQAHMDDEDNPHNDTLEQIRVYHKADVDAKFENVRQTLQTRLAALKNSVVVHAALHQEAHNINTVVLGMWNKQQVDARFQQMLQQYVNNTNGYYQVLALTNGSWSHYNDQAQAVWYFFTVDSGTGRNTHNLYVNGVQISDARNMHTNWQKSIMVFIKVPAYGSVTISATGTVYALRFVPV